MSDGDSKGELIIGVGPSGCGKSELLRQEYGSKTEAYTYTTRSIRPKEIDGVDRHFVSRDDFESLRRSGKIVGEYDAFGERYGFAAEIPELVVKGKRIVEQVVPLQGVKSAENAFQQLPLTKILFLAEPKELELRLKERSQADFQNRLKANETYIREYLQNVAYFDDIKFIPPSRLLNSQIESVQHSIEAFKTSRKENDVFDSGDFLYKWLIEQYDSLTLNPHLYTQMCLTSDDYLEKTGLFKKNAGDPAITRTESGASIRKGALDDVFNMNSLIGYFGGSPAGWIEYIYAGLCQSDSREWSSQRNPIKREVLRSFDVEFSRVEEYQEQPADNDLQRTGLRHLSAFFALSPLNSIRELSYSKASFIDGDDLCYPLFQSRFEPIVGGLIARLNLHCFEVTARVLGLAGDEIKPVFDHWCGNQMIISGNILERAEAITDPKTQKVPEIIKNWALVENAIAPSRAAHFHNTLDYYAWAYARHHPDSEKEELRTYLPEYINVLTGYMSTNIHYPLMDYCANALVDFLDNMIKISSADPSSPASAKNLLSYPFFKNRDQFIRGNLQRSIPSRFESLPKIISSAKILEELLQ